VVASDSRVAELNARHSPLDDISDDGLAGALDAGPHVAAPADARLSEADAIFVCVPTPVTTTNDPNLGPVLAAALVRDSLRRDQPVVLQPTTYPGTTSGSFRATLGESGLRAGEHFDLALCTRAGQPGRSHECIAHCPPAGGWAHAEGHVARRGHPAIRQ
jgi:UDP-N-acetyl-D-glucosamine dehydrogenase